MTPLSLILFLKDNKNKPQENTKTAGEEYYLEIIELTNKTTERNAWKFGVRDRTAFHYKASETFFKKIMACVD